MNDPTIVMIGAGAMGGVIAGALARAGANLTIIDTDPEHVAAINRDGLRVEGLGDGAAVRVPAVMAPEAAGWADIAVVMAPAFETANAARTANHVLKADGAAVSCQNGLGNKEALVAELGADRVFMGSTRTSADRPVPGCPRVTKLDPTTLGELDGAPRRRSEWLAETMTRGGLETSVNDNIEGVLWSKFITNCCINALSAITGLRMGEVSRVEGLGDLRWEIVDEAMAVVRAKGINLTYADPYAILKPHVWRKFTRPSMLQHVDQGRPVEIDAINGYLVAEAEKLGIPVPINRAVTALARGRALAARQDLHGHPDYAAMTAEADAEINRGETPWDIKGD